MSLTEATANRIEKPVMLPRHINQSQIKMWRRCQRQWWYHYGLGVEPKVKARPLTLGSWGHRALETHYVEGDWRIGYREGLEKYKKLFLEERQMLEARKGSLPEVISRNMRGYAYHYRNENLKVRAIEKSFEVPLKNITFKGRIDILFEDEDGHLWLGDHKWVTSIPSKDSFHAMDLQLLLYPWAAQKAWGIEIHGVFWNYIRSKAPSVPKLIKSGAISKSKVDTDYLTYKNFLVLNDFDPKDFSDQLEPLRKQSPFLQRYWLAREPHVLKQIVLEALTTGREINLTGREDYVTRNITKDCSWCSYRMLCRADLERGDRDTLIKRYYQKVEDDGSSSFAQFDDLGD